MLMSACSHKRRCPCLLCLFCFLLGLLWFLQRQLRFSSNFFSFLSPTPKAHTLSFPSRFCSLPFFSAFPSIFTPLVTYWVTAWSLYPPKLFAFSEDFAIPEFWNLGLEVGLDWIWNWNFYNCRNLLSGLFWMEKVLHFVSKFWQLLCRWALSF